MARDQNIPWDEYRSLFHDRPFNSHEENTEDPLSSEALSRYTLELSDLDFENDMPIIFINNTKASGVFHGRSPICQQTEQASRGFRRYWV
jgi:hypothetical protein